MSLALSLIDARLGAHRHALVEPLQVQLEWHAVRSRAEPRPRDQSALRIAVPADPGIPHLLASK
eukprot:7033362-Prymnesium_polylepis.1